MAEGPDFEQLAAGISGMADANSKMIDKIVALELVVLALVETHPAPAQFVSYIESVKAHVRSKADSDRILKHIDMVTGATVARERNDG